MSFVFNCLGGLAMPMIGEHTASIRVSIVSARVSIVSARVSMESLGWSWLPLPSRSAKHARQFRCYGYSGWRPWELGALGDAQTDIGLTLDEHWRMRR